ncbi:hypothetical protein E2562_012259 [Oryza meyeriana var. granulata]|uniref:F-box domain-containing protein n=1 Tax=Oryza meyeriana var. granulata TaxID=110450 RepID=A0A6G1D2Q4_9ORYZ|nr:hypothetical protein E2562_012259 [Oryza meyeriana var. granulata]
MARDGGLPDAKRRPLAEGSGAGADLISELPDDVLLVILARLRCARAAAATGILYRRWHGLWEKLPEVSIRGVSPDALDARRER